MPTSRIQGDPCPICKKPIDRAGYNWTNEWEFGPVCYQCMNEEYSDYVKLERSKNEMR